MKQLNYTLEEYNTFHDYFAEAFAVSPVEIASNQILPIIATSKFFTRFFLICGTILFQHNLHHPWLNISWVKKFIFCIDYITQEVEKEISEKHYLPIRTEDSLDYSSSLNFIFTFLAPMAIKHKFLKKKLSEAIERLIMREPNIVNTQTTSCAFTLMYSLYYLGEKHELTKLLLQQDWGDDLQGLQDLQDLEKFVRFHPVIYEYFLKYDQKVEFIKVMKELEFLSYGQETYNSIKPSDIFIKGKEKCDSRQR